MKKTYGLILNCDYATIQEVKQIIELGKGKIITFARSDNDLYIIDRKLWLKVLHLRRLLDKKVKH